MTVNSINEFLNRFLFLSVLNIIMLLLFLTVVCILIKTNNLDYFLAFRVKQKIISFVVSVYIFGFFTLSLGFVVWTTLFLLLRYVIIKNDKYRLSYLYTEYELQKLPYPTASSLSQLKEVFKTPKANITSLREFNYNFSNHIDCYIIAGVLLLIGITEIQPEPILLYGFEYFSFVIMFSVLFGKLLYKVFLNSPQSVTYLSPNLTYIPVVFFELIYYVVVVAIFYTTV